MKISVFGAGYVGVVACGCLASSHEIIAVDISADKIAMLNRGQSPIVEAEINDLIANAVRRGALRATGDSAAAISSAPAAGSEVDVSPVPTPTRSVAGKNVVA